MNAITSTPSFSEFDPYVIPFQGRVIDAFKKLDFTAGAHEILLSSSVGAGKSLFMAHMVLDHVFTYPGSRVCLARLAMPDLRDTIYADVLEHLEGTVFEDGTELKEGVHYKFRDSNCSITLANGSEIISRSWADKKFKKLGSLKLSAAVVEQLEENDDNYWRAITYLFSRIGRLPHVPVNWVMYGANPDGPDHPAYDYFELDKRLAGSKDTNPMRHVFFSRTEENPFLPEWYIENLKENLDPKMARRLVYGEWVEIDQDRIYYAYGPHNFEDSTYEIDPLIPIHISFDFNIAAGKPMSAVLIQHTKLGQFTMYHAFNEAVVHGADTEELMEDIASRGFLDIEDAHYIINGDATGGAKTAASKKSNYDIIREFLAKYRYQGERISFEIAVPKANPPIRKRHNLVNGICKNANDRIRLKVYKPCKVLDKGMRLTALKKGGLYIEDDSKDYQHVTTALGYHITWNTRREQMKQPNVRVVQAR